MTTLRTLPSNTLLPGIREQLAEAHLWIVWHWVDKRRRFPLLDLDDLESAGMAALWRAAEVWRADGGASFRVYATTWVRSAIQRAVIVQRQVGFTYRGGVVPTRIHPGRPNDKGRAPPHPCETLTAYTEAPWERMDREAVWEKLQEYLTPEQLEYARMRWWLGLTLKQIGTQYGRTKEWARLREETLLRRLRSTGRELLASVTGWTVPTC